MVGPVRSIRQRRPRAAAAVRQARAGLLRRRRRRRSRVLRRSPRASTPGPQRRRRGVPAAGSRGRAVQRRGRHQPGRRRGGTGRPVPRDIGLRWSATDPRAGAGPAGQRGLDHWSGGTAVRVPLGRRAARRTLPLNIDGSCRHDRGRAADRHAERDRAVQPRSRRTRTDIDVDGNPSSLHLHGRHRHGCWSSATGTGADRHLDARAGRRRARPAHDAPARPLTLHPGGAWVLLRRHRRRRSRPDRAADHRANRRPWPERPARSRP